MKISNVLSSTNLSAFFVVAVVVLAHPCFGQTTISGTLSGSQEWTPAGNPYSVIGTVTLTSGASLSIDAGVKIVFKPGASLVVLGDIAAIGTKSSPVEITSDSSDGTSKLGVPSQFAGNIQFRFTEIRNTANFIWLATSASGNVTFSHCSFIDDAQIVQSQGGNYTNTTVTFDSSLIRYCSNPLSFGLVSGTIIRGNTIDFCNGPIFSNWPGSGSAVITGNVFTNCTVGPIINTDDIYGSTKIDSNQFLYNTVGSVISYSRPYRSQSEIRNNLFVANSISNSLMSFWIVGQPDSNFIEQNVFSSNSGLLMEVGTPSFPVSLFARNNWWGTMDTSYIHQNYLQDFYTNYRLIPIYVSPVLTSLPEATSPLPPSNLQVTGNSSSSISISWSASLTTNIQGYKIYYGEDTSGYPYSHSIQLGDVNSASIPNLIAGHSYFIAVTAISSTGQESWYSKEVIGQTIPPLLEVLTPSLTFPGTAVGDSAKLTAFVGSGNSSPLIIDSLHNNQVCFRFPVTPPITVNGNDSAAISVTFKPGSFGSFSDTLSVFTNGGTAKIPLSGQSPTPTFISSAQTINFGPVVRNGTASKPLVIKNNSVNGLIIDSLYTATPAYTVSPKSGVVKVGDSLVVNVSLSVNTFGIFSDTLYALNNSLTPIYKIPLSGNSPFQVVFNGASLDCGEVTVGDSIDQVLLLGNIFNGATTIDSIFTNTHEFYVSPTHAYLNTMDTLQLDIRFKPDGFRTFKDTVSIIDRALSSRIWVALTGESPSPTVVTNSNMVDFDSTRVNTTSMRMLSLTNSSINALHVDSLMTMSKNFSAKITAMSGAIYRGDTVSVQVYFTPVSAGHFTDTLSIFTNSTNGVHKVALQGWGTLLTGLEAENSGIPNEYALFQNYPNPFNPVTTIGFAVPYESQVTVIIYDILGRVVTDLVDQRLQPGYYNARWDASRFASGVYFYRIAAQSLSGDHKNFVQVKKLFLLK